MVSSLFIISISIYLWFSYITTCPYSSHMWTKLQNGPSWTMVLYHEHIYISPIQLTAVEAHPFTQKLLQPVLWRKLLKYVGSRGAFQWWKMVMRWWQLFFCTWNSIKLKNYSTHKTQERHFKHFTFYYPVHSLRILHPLHIAVDEPPSTRVHSWQSNSFWSDIQ